MFNMSDLRLLCAATAIAGGIIAFRILLCVVAGVCR